MKKRTLNPVYNESFVFDLPSTVVDLHNVCIEFCVFDHDRVTKNEVKFKTEHSFSISKLTSIRTLLIMCAFNF